MKARTLMLALALCFTGTTAALLAQDPNLGTWKLNESKSHIPAGMPMNSTVVYEAQGDNVKVSMDGTRDGKPVHTEWTGKFDGKDYPVTGDPISDARAYTKVNSHTLTAIAKKDGKVTTRGRAVVSKDGKTRTVTLSGTDPSGKKFDGTAVYDKQ